MATEYRTICPTARHNYVAFFLTLACNLRCSYCINLHDGGTRVKVAKRSHLEPDEWITAANRFALRKDLPLTLQGGEPTLSKAFFPLVRDADPAIAMDLMTNLTFDEELFIREVPVWRFNREAPYAPIRVSYHPGQNDIQDLIRKTQRLQEAGFRVGIYGILHPEKEKAEHILEVQKQCLDLGIDFRTKEYLGDYNGQVYGTFRYEGAVSSESLRDCDCRTSEFIVDPAGYLFRCHTDLYEGLAPIGEILDPSLDETVIDRYRECSYFGRCNPCDVKLKTNRFQNFGHTSCEVINLSPDYNGLSEIPRNGARSSALRVLSVT
jgi:Radical SAM superfamily